MITAVLMIGERLVGIKEIAEPLLCIRYCVAMMATAYEDTSISYSSSSTCCGSTIIDQRIIFRLHRRIGYKEYEYQYDHIETNERFAVSTQEAVELLREPDEKVNLQKLKDKLRGDMDTKKRLQRFFAAN